MHVCWWWQSNRLVSVILLSFCLTDIWFGSTIRLNYLVLATCRTAASLSSFHKWFSINHLRRPNLFYPWQLQCESELFWNLHMEEWCVISLIFCARYNVVWIIALGTTEISQVVKCIRFKKSKLSQSYPNSTASRNLLLLSGDTECNPGWHEITVAHSVNGKLHNLQIQLYLLIKIMESMEVKFIAYPCSYL